MKKFFLFSIFFLLIGCTTTSVVSSSNVSSFFSASSSTTNESSSQPIDSTSSASSTSTSINTSSTVTQSTSSSSVTSTTSSSSTSSSSPTPDSPYTALSVTGFAQQKVRNFDESSIVRVSDEKSFLRALMDETITAIQIENDLNLGSKETAAMGIASSSIYKAHGHQPLLHLTLMESGIGRISLTNRKNLLLFSTTGITIRHCAFQFTACENIVIRNIQFDELWEWDDTKGKDASVIAGDYDINDWDYITIESSDGVWIDHCRFGKSYDGLIDAKKGSKNITISFSSFDAGTMTPFLDAQMDALEQSYLDGSSDVSMYAFLRKGGMTKETIAMVACLQKKGHLIGSSDTEANVNQLSITIAYSVYTGLMDRLPRLRGGNAHLINVIHDATAVQKAYKAIAPYSSLLSQLKSAKLQNGAGGKFGVTRQAVVSTLGGAVKAENCRFVGIGELIKNNQVDASKAEYTGRYLFEECEDVQLNQQFEVSSETVFTTDGTDKKYARAIGNAPCIAFSWTQFSVLPYKYTALPISEITQVLENALLKAGAGVVVMPAKEWTTVNYGESTLDPEPEVPVEPTEPSEYSFSYLFNQSSLFTLEEYESKAVEDMTLYGAGEVVSCVSVSSDEYTFSKRFKLNGGMNVEQTQTKKAVALNVTKGAEVTIYCASSNAVDARTVQLRNQQNQVLQAVDSVLACQKVSFTITESGTVFFGSKSSGLFIYAVMVTT